jgi:hypothetical protein
MAKAKLAKIPDGAARLCLTVVVAVLIFIFIHGFPQGIVIIEVPAGESPLKGDSIATIVFQITAARPASPLGLAPGVRNEMQAVAATALRHPMDQRFQGGAELPAARALTPAG